MIGGDWPLTGRDHELALVTGLIRAGDRAGVVLAGPAGVGKSRLAAECLADADVAGMATVRVAATRSAAGLPFGAFAALLPAGDDASANQAAFVRRCCEALAERAAGRRLVLLVDDAHLLDDASAVLFHQTAQSGTAFVVATVRTGEVLPDAVAALWKDGLARRVDLDVLPSDAVDRMLVAALGGAVDAATVTRLAARSQGNALFLRELVLGAAAAGALAQDRGLWRLVGPLTPSDRLVEQVEARLAGLDAGDRAALEAVAVGEPLGPAEFAALADLEVADSLERQGLLRSHSDGRRLQLRLAHPLYGDVLRARISALRARILACTLADAVEASGVRRREDILRVATWRLDGGGDADPELMLGAAYQARSRWDLPLAERLVRAAREAGGGFDAGLFVGQLCHLQGRGDDAEAELAALVGQATDDAQRARLAVARMDNLAWGMGRPAEALAVAEEAEDTIGDPGSRDEVTAKRGGLLFAAGRSVACLDLLEPVLARAQGATLASACIWAAYSLGVTGRAAEAIAVSRRGLESHRSLTGSPMTWKPHVHIPTRGFALTYAGRLHDAEAVARAEYERGVAEGDVEVQRLLAWQLATTMLVRGRPVTAARLAREAVDLFHGRLALMARVAYMPLVHALALTGDITAARGALAEFDALDLPATDCLGAEMYRSRAWVDACDGDMAAARRWLHEAVGLARRNGESVVESAALHDLARLGDAADVRDHLCRLRDLIEGDLAATRAAHASGLVAGDGSALETVSDTFDGMGADLLAAEAAADAAVAWRRAGDSRKAAAAEQRAHMLAARCEGATTPALQAIEARAVLTKGERDVAVLAAAGRSNPEIAETLHLSRKTVENYLSRVYEKLGITSRAELAAALHD